MGLGYLYARRFGPDMASANRLNLEIFTPALIFSVLSGEGFELARYAELAFAAMLVVLGSGLIAWPFARLFGYGSKVFLPPMMFNNSGNMGLPLALFAFGEAALPAAMILFLVENTLHFTVGNAMLTGHVNPLKLIRMPMLAATLAGLVVAVSRRSRCPGPCTRRSTCSGEVAIPLMLFALGVRMTGVDLSDWRIGMAGALICPLTGLLMAWLVGADRAFAAAAAGATDRVCRAATGGAEFHAGRAIRHRAAQGRGGRAAGQYGESAGAAGGAVSSSCELQRPGSPACRAGRAGGWDRSGLLRDLGLLDHDGLDRHV